MRTFWRNQRPVRNGLIVSGVILAIGFGSIAAPIALGYRGECGGLLPFLAGPRPCTFLEYFAGTMTLTMMIIAVDFWWIIALVVALPVVAAVLGGRSSRSGPHDLGA